MIQIILTIIEDLFMSFFISNYSNIEKGNLFIAYGTIIFSIETTIVQYISELSLFLPMIMILTSLLIIFYYKGKILFNDFIGSLLGPIIILLTDFVSLLLFGFIFSVSLNYITSNSFYLLSASLLSKVLLIVAYIIILDINSHRKILVKYKDWWIILPIWLVVFIVLYYLGEAIVFNNVTIHTIYMISLFLLILSILLLILFYKINKVSDIKHKNELIKQKEFYIKKNYEMLKKLHYEMTEVEHSTTYNYLHIKGLLFNKKYDEMESFLNNKIYDLKKIKNIINSGNPYFDYVMNKMVNNMLLQNHNIKTSLQITNKKFEIKNVKLDLVVLIIEYLFSVSNKRKAFNIDIIQKNKYLIIQLIANDINLDNKEFKKISKSNEIKCNYKKIDDYCIIKILIETELFH